MRKRLASNGWFDIQIFYIRSGIMREPTLSFIQAENVANHIMFVLLNDPGFGTFFPALREFPLPLR